MGDITDLFVTNSRTRVTPQKSYVASYSLTGSVADTGATLQVANGQFYAVIFQCNGLSTGTMTATLLQSGVTNQTFTVAQTTNSVAYLASMIFQNTSGSTVTVKLQATDSSGSPGSLLNIQLVSGSFVVAINGNSGMVVPINAYITNLEMIGASLFTLNPVGVLHLSNNSATTTTSVHAGLNIFVTGINVSATSDSTVYTTSLASFDFDGKTLAL